MSTWLSNDHKIFRMIYQLFSRWAKLNETITDNYCLDMNHGFWSISSTYMLWFCTLIHILLKIEYEYTVKWKLVNQNINTVISRVWFQNWNVLFWNEHICWRSKVSYHLFTHKCKGKLDMLLKHILRKTHIYICIYIQRIIMKKNKLSNLDLKSAL